MFPPWYNNGAARLPRFGNGPGKPCMAPILGMVPIFGMVPRLVGIMG